MCSQPKYVCLTSNMNARTGNLCDFVTADSFIADLLDFDDEIMLFFNEADMLSTIGINKHRVSLDTKTNNNGYKLIDICRNNNLYILNGRFGRDKTEGKLTFRNQSLIDYTICSFNCLKLLKDFEVIDTDPIYSDGHALLSWTINCNVLLKENCQQFQTQPTYKKWDAIHSTEFTENLPTERVRELCVNLKPNKDSINRATTEIANIFIETAKMTFPTQRKFYRTGNDKPWFGGKCRVARNKYHQIKKRFKRTQNYNDKHRLITASKVYKRTMNFFINKQKQKNEDKLRQIHSTK